MKLLSKTLKLKIMNWLLSDKFGSKMPPVNGRRNFDMNRGAIFEDTSGVRPSRPLHVGAYSRTDERERLQSTYNLFHDRKLGFHDRK